MTEEEIERRVERSMDMIDRKLMAGTMSQAEYDQAVKDLNAWAERQYSKRRT